MASRGSVVVVLELVPDCRDHDRRRSLEQRNITLHAIQRAANRARQVAQQTGTDLIVVRSGQLVRVRPPMKPVV